MTRVIRRLPIRVHLARVKYRVSFLFSFFSESSRSALFAIERALACGKGSFDSLFFERLRPRSPRPKRWKSSSYPCVGPQGSEHMKTFLIFHSERSKDGSFRPEVAATRRPPVCVHAVIQPQDFTYFAIAAAPREVTLPVTSSDEGRSLCISASIIIQSTGSFLMLALLMILKRVGAPTLS